MSKIKFFSWKNIKSEINCVDPILTNIIDKINPLDDEKLIKINFPYGAKIIEKGKFRIPNESGELVPLDHVSISKSIRDMLDYNIGTNPASLVVNNAVEIFIPLHGRIISLYGPLKSGAILSTSRILSTSMPHPHSPAFLWEMTAGARSLFMLPKITNNKAYGRLRREFGTHFIKPTQLNEQWQLFKKLTLCSHSQWNVEIIYFPKSWINRFDDPAWKDLRNYLLQSAWNGSEFWRNQFVWKMVFSLIQEKRCLKINPYIADIVKNLMFMTAGSVPGFSSATDDSVAPIKMLQSIFNDIYKLEYAATFMTSCLFSNSNSYNPVYFSLGYPALQEFSPRNRLALSRISELYEVKLVLKKYIDEIISNRFNISDTYLYEMLKKVRFKFLHSTVSPHYQGIHLNDEKQLTDLCLPANNGSLSCKPLAINSIFLQGCIQMTHF